MNDKDFNIFLICGRSGSGKSTILRNIADKDVKMPSYDNSRCVISQFPSLTEEQACDLLSGVGLSSVPIWLRKPNELSNGEKARLDVCKSIKDKEDKMMSELHSKYGQFGLQDIYDTIMQ